MKIALAQMEIEQDNKFNNLLKIKNTQKKAVLNKVDIVVFPELTYTGYLHSKEEFYNLSESNKGDFVKEICRLSKENNIYILAGYVGKDNEDLYNAVILTDKKGNSIFNYRKTYLWKKENIIFKSGENIEFIDTEFEQI